MEAMNTSRLLERVQELTDVELAMLLSLVANQHCIIKTKCDALDSLAEEIQLIAANVFGLGHAVVRCNGSTTPDDFSNRILVKRYPGEEFEDRKFREAASSVENSCLDKELILPRFKSAKSLHEPDDEEDERNIADIVVVTGLGLASSYVQIQALELLRTRRIFTHKAVYAVPKMFLLIVLESTMDPPLVHHLNDRFFISHYHDLADGFANLEEGSEWIEDDRASLSSVVHRSVIQDARLRGGAAVFPADEIRAMADLSGKVRISAEIKSYIQNIATFLRMHRAVSGGISPRASQHFDILVKCLAPLHGLNFVTPSLVPLASRKIYSHRITITKAGNERSLQYGSEFLAISAILEGYTPDLIIEEALAEIESPT